MHLRMDWLRIDEFIKHVYERKQGLIDTFVACPLALIQFYRRIYNMLSGIVT
jgi:hypothetical protein